MKMILVPTAGSSANNFGKIREIVQTFSSFWPDPASLAAVDEMNSTLPPMAGPAAPGGGMKSESPAETSSTFSIEPPQGGMSGERPTAPHRKGGTVFHVKVSRFRTSAGVEERMENPMTCSDTREV